jgi:hypothetical protein
MEHQLNVKYKYKTYSKRYMKWQQNTFIFLWKYLVS